MSFLKHATIKTSKTNKVNIIVTAQQIENNYHGNPRYLIQVWIDRDNGNSNLWYPKIIGFRENKRQGYILTSYNIGEDLKYFIKEFEQTIYQD